MFAAKVKSLSVTLGAQRGELVHFHPADWGSFHSFRVAIHCQSALRFAHVTGGVEMVENRQFEIPENSWHGISAIRIPHWPIEALEEGRSDSPRKLKKIELKNTEFQTARFMPVSFRR